MTSSPPRCVVVLAALHTTLLVACATSPTPQPDLSDGRFVRAPAARLDVHYDVTPGTSSSTREPALVLLHPWGADLDIWHEVLPALSAERTVVRVDLPAHGRSGAPPGRYPPRRLAQAVLAVLDALALERVVVVGNSIGGATALALAELAPSRTAGLVLVGAPGGQPVPAFAAAMVDRALSPRALATVSTEVLWGAWAMLSDDGPGVRRMIARSVDERVAPGWPAVAAARASALAEVIRFAPALEALRVPTLVVYGAHDPVVWPSAGEALARRIPGAQAVVLDDCGHFPELECPRAFEAAVLAFVRGSQAR